MNKCLLEACNSYGLTTDGVSYGNGHINTTFLAEKDGKKYIIQSVNTNVFKNPNDMMDNVCKVTDFIKEKVKSRGGNADREIMSVLKTKTGENLCTTSNGDVYRAYTYISESITINENPTPEIFYQAGLGFGRFQEYLSDFPANELVETIEKFHHTPSRVESLKKTVKEDKLDRVKNCEDILKYILDFEKEAGIIISGIENKDIPIRVTHNDTKLNNILFDKDTKEAICVIDLDTVMPGSALYDFGDAIRYGANTAKEDEKDLDKVSIDLKLFESFTKGFTKPLKNSLTKYETDLLAFSSKLLTYECAVRFLDDYLAGNKYFKVDYEDHNLVRAKNQIKMCQDIDLKFNEMDKIVKDILK